MDLLEQAAFVQELQVAPDGHVGDTQRLHKIGHANSTVLAYLLENQSLALACKGRPPDRGVSDP
jgi:hypothetical protein